MENLFNKLFKEKNGRITVQFLRFSLVGTFATAIDFLVYTLFLHAGVHLNFAIFFGFITGYVANYLLSAFWVFQSKNPFSFKELFKFALVALVGLLMNYVVIHLLLWSRLLELLFPMLSVKSVQMVAKLIATLVATVWNFIGRRQFVYR